MINLDKILNESKSYSTYTSIRKKIFLYINAIIILYFVAYFYFVITDIVYHDEIGKVLFYVGLCIIFIVPVIKLFIKIKYRNNERVKANIKKINVCFDRKLPCKYGESFCINDGSKKEKNSDINKKCIRVFVALAAIHYAIALCLYIVNIDLCKKAQVNIWVLLIVASMGLFFYGAISFGIYKIICLRRICTQRVDAVCIDIKYRKGGSLPIFYYNYNNKGYVVFNNTYSNLHTCLKGDFIPDMKINPDNPFEYVTCATFSTTLIMLLLGLMSVAPIILIFINVFL